MDLFTRQFHACIRFQMDIEVYWEQRMEHCSSYPIFINSHKTHLIIYACSCLIPTSQTNRYTVLYNFMIKLIPPSPSLRRAFAVLRQPGYKHRYKSFQVQSYHPEVACVHPAQEWWYPTIFQWDKQVATKQVDCWSVYHDDGITFLPYCYHEQVTGHTYVELEWSH